MFIEDSFLEELRERCRIEDIVAQYVQLKRSGGNLSGLCPFHSEKTPSFMVSPDKQIFHCFGCGVGGNVISFIMRMENLEFPDAVEFLAQKAGLAMPEGKSEGEGMRRRARTYELNRLAARFFYENLISPAGEEALKYLTEKRRLSMSTVKRFGLGFSLNEWDSLIKHLRSKGAATDELIYSGLAVKGKSGGIYDRFRNRVMFPIIDVRGNVIGFGARVMDDSLPKYLNSPDSPAFNKSRNLFAMNFTKNDRSGRIILAEGYMDVIALHAAGFTNAVASLGTSLTTDQARLMSRYCREVVISYDSDAAGRNAAQRAIDILKDAGLAVRVLRIEGGKDPDEFIREHGAERFARLIEGSGNYIDYRLDALAAPYDMSDIRQKADFLSEAAKVLVSIDSAVERELYTGRISKQYGISVQALESEIKKLQAKRKREFAQRQKRDELERMRPHKAVRSEARGKGRVARAEEQLLHILYEEPELIEGTAARLAAGDFSIELNARLFTFFTDTARDGGQPDITLMDRSFTPDEVSYLSGVLCGDMPDGDRSAAVGELIELMTEEKSRRAALSDGDANDETKERELIQWYEQMKKQKR